MADYASQVCEICGGFVAPSTRRGRDRLPYCTRKCYQKSQRYKDMQKAYRAKARGVPA